MGEVVDELDLFHQVTGDAPDQLAQVVLREVLRHPEGHVLEARRELGVRLKLGVERAGLELLQEALVGRPEEPDVGDIEQHHRQPLQPEPKRPGFVTLTAVAVQNLLLHDAAAEHFEPLSVEKDLQLEGRLRERKVRVNPSHLHVSKQLLRESLQCLLQLLLAVRRSVRRARRLPLLLREHPHALHLVEHRVVRSVDRIPPVYVSSHQEGREPLPQRLCLVRTSVATQDRVCVHVVRIVRRPRHVVRRHQHLVKIGRGLDHRMQIVKLGKRVWIVAVEERVDGRLDDPQRVAVDVMQVDTDLLIDVVRDVVGRVAGDDLVPGDGDRGGRRCRGGTHT